jgi:hypothetical protein
MIFVPTGFALLAVGILRSDVISGSSAIHHGRQRQ